MTSWSEWDQLLDRWVVGEDLTGVLARERAEYTAVAGRHVLGWLYVDHEMGISMHVQSFGNWWDDRLRVDASPLERGIAIMLRYSVLEQLSLTPLPDQLRQEFGLPKTPEWAQIYECPALETARRSRFLDPLRAPGFPDDIKVLLNADGYEPEIVWARMERQLEDELYECILLNQPSQDFGLAVQDRIVVMVRLVGNGLVSACLGRVADLLES